MRTYLFNITGISQDHKGGYVKSAFFSTEITVLYTIY